jgi:transketolase
MLKQMTEVKMEKTRTGWGHGLVDLGDKDERIVVLVGDLMESTNVNFFAEKFPKRFIQVGVAEQNMALLAAGLSLIGKIPFFSTYGAFAAYRCLDMLRITLSYSNVNVKIGGAHGGISVGPDGATHQAMEEISILRSLPNMQMIVPCDYWETRKATLAAAAVWGPVYIRFGREPVPVVTDESTPFIFGKANTYREGGDVAIIACGTLVYESLVAAEVLAGEGIDCRVIDMHTIKPIDREAIIKAARECGAIVTAEEHQVMGGLGGAIAEVVVAHQPVPMEFVAVMDRFGQSGKPDELMAAFGLKSKDVIAAVKRVLKRKS